MNATWTRKQELAFVESEDRVVVLDLDRLDELPLVLTGSAAAIWSFVDRKRAVDGICAELSAEFGIESDAIRPQVLDFLGELAARNLIISA